MQALLLTFSPYPGSEPVEFIQTLPHVTEVIGKVKFWDLFASSVMVVLSCFLPLTTKDNVATIIF